MQDIITADQSRAARRELGLSQADVSTAVGINRQYISEYETGYSNRITSAQQRKLRAYYEAKIQAAVDSGEEISLAFGDPDATGDTQQLAETNAAPASVEPLTDPEGVQRAVLAIRHLAIDPSVTREQIVAILEKIEANDREAEELLQAKAERGVFDDWSDDTDAMLKGVFGLFAANYVLLRHLQGRPLVMLASPVEYDSIKTVADIFAHLFHEGNAALVAMSEPDESDAGVEEVTA